MGARHARIRHKASSMAASPALHSKFVDHEHTTERRGAPLPPSLGRRSPSGGAAPPSAAQKHHAGPFTTRRHRRVHEACSHCCPLHIYLLHTQPAVLSAIESRHILVEAPPVRIEPHSGSARGALAALCIAIRHAAVDRSSQRPPCCQPRRAEVALSGDTTRVWEMDAALSAVQQAKSPKERLDAAEAWRVRRLWAQLACSALPPHCACAERTLWLPRPPHRRLPQASR